VLLLQLQRRVKLWSDRADAYRRKAGNAVVLRRELRVDNGQDAARATARPRASLFPGLDLFCIVRKDTARAAFGPPAIK